MAMGDMDRGIGHDDDGGDERYRLKTEDEAQETLRGGVRIARVKEFLEEGPWLALAGEGQRVIGRVVGKWDWFPRE